MLKICLIRGEKNYLDKRKYTYSINKDFNHIIDKWSNALNYNYWDFRSKLRDITIDNIKSQNFDLIFYNYEDFYYYIMFNNIEDDILFYGQDDDDLIISENLGENWDNVLYNQSYLFVWDWLFANLPERSFRREKDTVIQSNHCFLFIKKEDIKTYLNIKDDIFRYHGLSSLFNKDFLYNFTSVKKSLNYLTNKLQNRNPYHLYYHMGIDRLSKTTKIFQHYTKDLYSINFNHISSITNLREIEDFGLLKFTVNECINSIDYLISEYNIKTSSIYDIRYLYEQFEI